MELEEAINEAEIHEDAWTDLGGGVKIRKIPAHIVAQMPPPGSKPVFQKTSLECVVEEITGLFCD